LQGFRATCFALATSGPAPKTTGAAFRPTIAATHKPSFCLKSPERDGASPPLLRRRFAVVIDGRAATSSRVLAGLARTAANDRFRGLVVAMQHENCGSISVADFGTGPRTGCAMHIDVFSKFATTWCVDCPRRRFFVAGEFGVGLLCDCLRNANRYRSRFGVAASIYWGNT
jgi:hypothetical protein